MRAEPGVTRNEATYLKLIYREQHEGSGEVKTTTAARTLGVRPATVTEVLQNLAEKKLLRYERYRGVELTEEGITRARKLLRKHRILEVLFADLLGYDFRRACEEASKLDYHVSMDLINDVCWAYGHPETCPCNKTIFSDPMCKKG